MVIIISVVIDKGEGMPTLEEARNLWCPFARGAELESPDGDDLPESINRAWQGEARSDCMCLADGCMAWRWVVPDGCKVYKGGLWRLGLDGKTWDMVPGWIPEGYCGLAGKM